ncbi:MAG: hypothetical protein HUJ26_23645 [Planctomycetaceae bacterium]|nr:hypothetical protein [Planctomycetaceae bacterium]
MKKFLVPLSMMFVAVTFFMVDADTAQGQSIAQRRQHPGTYSHQPVRSNRTFRLFERPVMQSQAASQPTQSRSFSFEPADTQDALVAPAPTTRSRVSRHSHLGLVPSKRLHPGTH